MEAKEWVVREVAHVRTDSLEEGREEGLLAAKMVCACL